MIKNFCDIYEKTFQFITFVKTLFENPKLTKTNKIIIVVENVDQLREWRLACIKCLNGFNIFDITAIKRNRHLNLLNSWVKNGGLLLISYKVFKELSIIKDYEKCLINPGADLVIFDEYNLNCF